MDIKCVVCGEPWDSYGIRHGDMLPWEADLFRKGAGCPCCKGEPNGFAPETLSDIENGDEDPMDRILARETHEKGLAPKWDRPSDPVHWECDACGVECITDLDSNELEFRAPYKSLASYRGRHRYCVAEKEAYHTFESGTRVCPDCYKTCDHCSEAIEPETGYFIQSAEKEVCSDTCLSTVEDELAQDTWRSCYSDSERLAYIRDNWSQFDSCHAKYTRDKCEAWRRLLANVRGLQFDGYASELIG